MLCYQYLDKSRPSIILYKGINFCVKFVDIKVTVDLQGCLPKNHSHARVLCYNHRKVYIIVKVIKCRIMGNNFFWDLI